MSWFRNHKRALCRAAVGAAAISLTCFIWTGMNLYRNRKILEAEIAARNYADLGNGQGSSQESGQDNSQDNSQDNRQVSGQWDECLFDRDVVEYDGKQYRRNSYVKAILCIGVDRSGEMTEKTTTGFGGQGTPLWTETKSALPGDCLVKDYIAGLAGRDISLDTITRVYQDILEGEPSEEPVWIDCDTEHAMGIREVRKA